MEGEDPSFLAFLFGGQRGSLPCRVGQAGEVVGVGDVQFEVVGLLEFVLAELQAKLCKLGLDGSKAFLVLTGKEGAAAHESVVGVVQKLLLLRA